MATFKHHLKNARRLASRWDSLPDRTSLRPACGSGCCTGIAPGKDLVVHHLNRAFAKADAPTWLDASWVKTAWDAQACIAGLMGQDVCLYCRAVNQTPDGTSLRQGWDCYFCGGN